jgi:hypothetical protein
MCRKHFQLSSHGLFTGQLEPRFRRNGAPYFVAMSYPHHPGFGASSVMLRVPF